MTNEQNNSIESTTKSEKSIGIHYIGLEARELSIFDRVVAFNITHGLVAHKTTDFEEAELIVVNQNDYSEIEAETYSNKTIFMVCDTSSDKSVHSQVLRPLLITKVMNTLGETIEAVKEKRATQTAEPEESLSSIESNEVVNHENTVDSIVDESITTLESSVENSVEKNEAVSVIVESSEATKEESAIEKIDSAGETSQSGHHALVIDDSASIRKQLELELRDAGITSDFADSGEAALEKIKEGQFDLIFLDIIMPGIDGYETCKQMRATVEYKKTPIIMLSGKTSPLDEVQGVIAGATTYLTKPVKSDKLQETLNRVTKWIDNYSQPKKTEIV